MNDLICDEQKQMMKKQDKNVYNENKKHKRNCANAIKSIRFVENNLITETRTLFHVLLHVDAQLFQQ